MPGSPSRSGERVQKQKRALGRRLSPEGHATNTLHTQTEAEKRAINSQTKCLRLNNVTSGSSNFQNHNIFPVITDSKAATF